MHLKYRVLEPMGVAKAGGNGGRSTPNGIFFTKRGFDSKAIMIAISFPKLL